MRMEGAKTEEGSQSSRLPRGDLLGRSVFVHHSSSIGLWSSVVGGEGCRRWVRVGMKREGRGEKKSSGIAVLRMDFYLSNCFILELLHFGAVVATPLAVTDNRGWHSLRFVTLP